MKTCKLIALLLALLLSFSLVGWVTYKHFHKHNYVIHFVNYGGPTGVEDGFEFYLKTHHVPYTIIYHDENRDPSTVPGIIASIRADKTTDLVVTWGSTASLNIFGKYTDHNAAFITDIPGLFVLVADPVSTHLVPSMQSSKRNITGTSHLSPTKNQFEAMMVYHPAKRIGILYTPSEVNAVAAVDAMRVLALKHGVELVAIPFATENGKPNTTNAVASLIAMKKLGVEWLYLGPDTLLAGVARDLVIPEAHSLGILTFASTEKMMKSGASFGLICPYFVAGELIGDKAERILVDGVDPQDIPVDTCPRFRHQMNPIALKRFNIDLPVSMTSNIEKIAAP